MSKKLQNRVNRLYMSDIALHTCRILAEQRCILLANFRARIQEYVMPNRAWINNQP